MSAPFYFAWVDPTDNVFGVAHHVKDMDVYSCTRELSEGNKPTLSLEVRNPKIGLLAPGRKVWAWLSWFDGAVFHPIMFGRLVGIPTNILAETCTLSFIADPQDYVDQKQELAETLKVRPHYDPIFIDIAHRDDPDTVLEGYSAFWCVDPVTLEVTISDILVGEDGTEVFNESDSFYDSVSITMDQTPLTSVFVDASVTWTQQARGWIDMGDKTFEGYALGSLLGGWPVAQPGVKTSSIGGGWSSYNSTAVDVFQTGVAFNISGSGTYTNQEKTHLTGDTMSQTESFNKPLLLGPSIEFTTSVTGQTGILDPFSDPPVNIPSNTTINSIVIPQWQINTTMVLQYDASRARTEHLTFHLDSDLQAILTLPQSPGTSATERITISGADVSIPLLSYHELTDVPFDPADIPGYVPGTWPFGSSNVSSGLSIGGGITFGGHLYYIPIGDVSRRSYFPTDRGQWSIEYLISIARAHLLLRSRAVKVQFDCLFSRAIGLRLRMNAQLFDPRLPGGQAEGKIINVQLRADGDTGALIGTVTMACAVGRGHAVAAALGTPTYVVEGVFDPGEIQYYENAIRLLPAGDIGYSVPKDAPDDDGLTFPLDKGQVLIREQIHGSLGEQAATVMGAIPAQIQMTNQAAPTSYDDLAAQTQLAQQGINEALKRVPIWLELQLKPVVNGPFEIQYAIDVTSLAVPKQIDLEAPSSP